MLVQEFLITLLSRPILSPVSLRVSVLTAFHFYRGAEQSGSADVQRTASGEMLPTTELHWWRTSVEGNRSIISLPA